jgi:diacylglycerol kinase family enzyme
MREFTAVVNPSAGGGSGAAAALLPLTRLLREGGAEVEVAYRNGLDHARVLARQAGQAGRVVLAVGGDGMAGCVGGALAGSDAVLGLVPAGRGNDFARALGLPRETGALAELLLHARAQPVDAIEADSAHHRRVAVLGSVYAGVDALANRYANRSRLF